MVKSRTTISIDNELLEKAQEKMINVSGLTEYAIRQKLRIKEVEISEALKCDFCGVEGEQETIENLNSKSTNLVWLYPDERWICNSCFLHKSRQITK